MSTRVLVTEPDELLLETYERSLLERGFQIFNSSANGLWCARTARSWLSSA